MSNKVDFFKVAFKVEVDKLDCTVGTVTIKENDTYVCCDVIPITGINNIHGGYTSVILQNDKKLSIEGIENFDWGQIACYYDEEDPELLVLEFHFND